MVANLWICWVVGIFVGLVIATTIIVIKSSFGTFRIDCSDPEKDVYRLDIHSVDNIVKKKYIILRVDKNADLSQQ